MKCKFESFNRNQTDIFSPLHVQAEGPDPISAGLITKESVNQADSTYKRCVLHWLAANNKGKPENIITYEAVQCMKAGANVNARDCDDNTPLMLAVKAQRGRLVLNLLYRGADPRIFNKSERNALHEAAANKGHRIMEILLTDKRLLSEIDELERNGMTALMLVARCEGDLQVPMAELLLKNGAKVDADGASRKDSEIYRGRTALHYAALADNLPMAQFLVSRNAYKDKQDEAGKTPLMLAAKEGHERTVRYLISAGACLTIVDVMDKTAAQLARENYHYEIADILQKVLIEKTREESDRRNAASAFNHTNAGAKNGRQTFKAVKRTGSRKTPAPSTSSRESNHLTPPQSDGSFSSPSPMYFHTTASTPTAMESSPEYGYQHPDMVRNSANVDNPLVFRRPSRCGTQGNLHTILRSNRCLQTRPIPLQIRTTLSTARPLTFFLNSITRFSPDLGALFQKVPPTSHPTTPVSVSNIRSFKILFFGLILFYH